MPIDVIMPKVDMVMEEGTIAQWHKSEGDIVKAGDRLFDIETDKAMMEVEATASGTLARITAPDGTTVPVATVIALILEKGETLEQLGGQAAVNPSLPPKEAAQAHEPSTVLATANGGPRRRSTPVARKMAGEHGLDLATLLGSGPQGRIRKHDVLHAIDTMRAATPVQSQGGPAGNAANALVANDQRTTSGTSVSADISGASKGKSPERAQIANLNAGATQPSVTPTDKEGSDAGTLLPLVGVRKIIAQRLTLSAAIPQFTLSIDVELTAAMQLRERLPYRPSVTALLARVVAALLPRHPTLNASFREDGIWLHNPVHLGIALDSPGGLLVPVIRNAHRQSLREIATALSGIRKRAEAKELTPAELQGSTFSISNLGMLGIDQFTALINPPEAAILAVGRSTQRACDVHGTIEFKPMLTLTLSADHRVTDGANGARFLQDVRATLEDPLLLL
ncbi:MAG: pyruvate dehydrogenase complex dihydrolipoamide acetyltransferase [Herpetosiphon sp.]